MLKGFSAPNAAVLKTDDAGETGGGIEGKNPMSLAPPARSGES